jgi:hypothetical protein
MLSQTTIGYLSTLTYRHNAKRGVCWLPLSGIYWEDEMPDISHLWKMPKDDQHQVLRLFGIRARIWKGETLPDAEQRFWNAAQSLVPDWAFFQRQEVSVTDLRAQEEAERETTEGVESWFADADEVEVTEKNGVQSFSLTFDLTKEQRDLVKRDLIKKESWWKRIFHWGPPNT